MQRFFVEHLKQHRDLSPRTIAAYRDTFRLLLSFAEQHTGKPLMHFALNDLSAQLVLSFLDYLEREGRNGPRSRNARLPLAAIAGIHGGIDPRRAERALGPTIADEVRSGDGR